MHESLLPTELWPQRSITFPDQKMLAAILTPIKNVPQSSATLTEDASRNSSQSRKASRRFQSSSPTGRTLRSFDTFHISCPTGVLGHLRIPDVPGKDLARLFELCNNAIIKDAHDVLRALQSSADVVLSMRQTTVLSCFFFELLLVCPPSSPSP